MCGAGAPCALGQVQRVPLGDVDNEKAARDELAENRAPLTLGYIGADPEGRDLVVAVADHALVGLAAQNVDAIAGGVALAGAVDG